MGVVVKHGKDGWTPELTGSAAGFNTESQRRSGTETKPIIGTTKTILFVFTATLWLSSSAFSRRVFALRVRYSWNMILETVVNEQQNTSFEPPWPGSRAMPRWTTGELIDAPRVGWRNVLALIGPGVVMSASAVGGGEWLLGPTVTAKYGGSLMWL